MGVAQRAWHGVGLHAIVKYTLRENLRDCGKISELEKFSRNDFPIAICMQLSTQTLYKIGCQNFLQV